MTDGTMTGIDYFAWLVLIVIALKVAHVIRRVMIRVEAIMNYIDPR